MDNFSDIAEGNSAWLSSVKYINSHVRFDPNVIESALNDISVILRPSWADGVL